MVGWNINLARDIPFASIRMFLYESCSRLLLAATEPDHHLIYKHPPTSEPAFSALPSTSPLAVPIRPKRTNSDHLTAPEAAVMGLVSGALTAVITQPIDCVNTRIKSGELAAFGVWSAHAEIVRRDGRLALFRGLVPRALIMGAGSTVFWYWFAKMRSVLQAVDLK
jgi:hypothetical protein